MLPFQSQTKSINWLLARPNDDRLGLVARYPTEWNREPADSYWEIWIPKCRSMSRYSSQVNKTPKEQDEIEKKELRQYNRSHYLSIIVCKEIEIAQ